MQITLPDGSIKELPEGSSAYDVARTIGEGLAKAAIGAKVNGELYDLHRPLPGDCSLGIVTALTYAHLRALPPFILAHWLVDVTEFS